MHLNFAAVKVWFNEKIKYESEIFACIPRHVGDDGNTGAHQEEKAADARPKL